MQDTSDHDGAQERWGRVALSGADYPGLRIRAEVSQGDQVHLGQVLFRDRKRPQIAFAAPIDGRVTSIRFGARRMFSSLVIERTQTPSSNGGEGAPPKADDREAVRNTLLESGLWPSFTARPFGGIPDPEKTPAALFVTATRRSQRAPDPRNVLHHRVEAFSRGIDALALLTDGPIHLCQDTGQDLLPVTSGQAASNKVRIAKFRDKPGLGLPGTHIHRLFPVGQGREVWTIGYQDVIAIGHFLTAGQYDAIRTITLNTEKKHEPKKSETRTLSVPLGVDLRAFAPDTRGTIDQAFRLISGGVERGRTASFLGRYHEEVALTSQPVRSLSMHPQPIVPHQALDGAMPLNLLAVPLMRALSVGDVETAERLGCLELLEEDVAVLTARCTSGTDYGRCLRAVLDQLKEAA